MEVDDQDAAELKRIRGELDEIDNQLIRILARRFEIGQEAARVKRASGLDVHDPEREASVIAQARSWARESGLPEGQIEDLFVRLIGISRNSQISSEP